MEHLRWQWTLANLGVVTAVLDLERNTETVSQEGRVLSEGSRHSLPDGHDVMIAPGRQAETEDALHAVVTFADNAPICVLRVDGHEVAPTVWPARRRGAVEQAPQRSRLPMVVAGVVAAALVVIGMVSFARRGDSATSDARFNGIHRAANGLFIAHFPEDLEAKPAVLPNGVGGVLLENKPKTTSIVLTSLTLDSATLDPWIVQQRLRDEALANLPKGAARFEETARSDETCSGERGAVVTGQLVQDGVRRARVWTCAFVRRGAAYLVVSMIAEPATKADERRLRAIVEATELTRLTELGPAPEPSLPR